MITENLTLLLHRFSFRLDKKKLLFLACIALLAGGSYLIGSNSESVHYEKLGETIHNFTQNNVQSIITAKSKINEFNNSDLQDIWLNKPADYPEYESYIVSNLDTPFTFPEISEENFVIQLNQTFSLEENRNGQFILDNSLFPVMFNDSNTYYDGYDNFIYITQHDADSLVKSRNVKDYNDLINTSLELRYVIDGVEYSNDCKIANIIVPENEYILNAQAFLGNFVSLFGKLPYALQSDYIFTISEDTFYNNEILNYYVSLFSKMDYDFIALKSLSIDSERLVLDYIYITPFIQYSLGFILMILGIFFYSMILIKLPLMDLLDIFIFNIIVCLVWAGLNTILSLYTYLGLIYLIVPVVLLLLSLTGAFVILNYSKKRKLYVHI